VVKVESLKLYVFLYYKRNARKRKTPVAFELSFEEFCDLIGRNCYLCGAPPSNRAKSARGPLVFLYSGIDRVDNSMGYVAGNVEPCCQICNRMKNVMGLKEFKSHIKKILRR